MMDLQEVGCGGMYWFDLAQVASNCACGNEPLGFIKCGEFLAFLRTGWGHAVAQLIEALRYNSEGCGFDSRWCHWNFSLT